MMTASALTLPECDRLVASASVLQEQGDLLGAERLLRQVLSAFPAHPQGLHLAGILAHLSGQTELGLRLIERGIEGNPGAGLFYANAGEMARMLGRTKTAIEMGRKAVELEPGNANAWSNLGIALYDSGQWDEAERAHERALELAPQHTGSLNNMGSIWLARAEDDKAMAYYRAALDVNPAQVDPLNNLGAILLKQGRPAEAVAHLEAAVRVGGRHLGALCNLARGYCEVGRAVDAGPLLQIAAQLAPNSLNVLWASVLYTRGIGEFALALAQVERARSLYPDVMDLVALRMHLLMHLDRIDEALVEVDALLLACDKPNKDLLAIRAALHGARGESDAVRELLEPVLESLGHAPVLCYSLASAQKVKADAPVWKALSALETADKFDSVEDEVYFRYAMGKSLDDLGRTEEAFAQYQKANALKRSQFRYQIEAEEERFAAMATHFNAGLFERHGGRGHASEAPIFIVGMMRSGTSLMEQILASHPDVYGAGELTDFGLQVHEAAQLASQTDMRHGVASDQWGVCLSPAQLQAWGTQYLDRVARRGGEEYAAAQRFTDKLPNNFILIGLIRLVFPNARIIHMMRDPLDTCWSCYTQFFQWSHAYTCDLVELGRYYKAYEQLMAHWRQVLPPGAMLEVQYEELVKNQEQMTRQVLAYCGLEWNDACLQFHKTERSIRTASQFQVKQPMNMRSVLRSRQYEPMLGELVAALKA
ncbi:MAG: hypothetical protein RLZZ271_854 [Pseudomonadota bacterium]|jgi:tetratricopeptide (TPR) repeat protein